MTGNRMGDLLKRPRADRKQIQQTTGYRLGLGDKFTDDKTRRKDRRTIPSFHTLGSPREDEAIEGKRRHRRKNPRNEIAEKTFKYLAVLRGVDDLHRQGKQRGNCFKEKDSSSSGNMPCLGSTGDRARPRTRGYSLSFAVSFVVRIKSGARI